MMTVTGREYIVDKRNTPVISDLGQCATDKNNTLNFKNLIFWNGINETSKIYDGELTISRRSRYIQQVYSSNNSDLPSTVSD